MAASDLPDDPRHWPQNPFELIGVKPGSAETDIKRAYTRLIRRFKPEQFPDHFRRIREAYDECLMRNRWYSSVEPDDEPEAPGEPSVTTHRSEVESPTAATPGERAIQEPAALPPFSRPAYSDEADRFWAEAVEGREAEAYSGLVEQARSRPEEVGIALRLYWLLALNPALDSNRSRHEWLVDALARGRLQGPAAELYRRELEADPEAALSWPYRELLRTSANVSNRLTIARWRVAASGRTERWGTLALDLELLRDDLPMHDESGWLGLLVSARDWSAWSRPDKLEKWCDLELGRLRHLELSHGYAFDRLDETNHHCLDWREASKLNIPSELLRLVPSSWAGYAEVRRSDLAIAVAVVAANPRLNLVRFDRFAAERGTGFLTLLARVLEGRREMFEADDAEPYPTELIIRALLRGPVGSRMYSDFAALRNDLLEFLSIELIDPLELAAACEEAEGFRFRHLAAPLRADVPLRVVWLAVWAYRR